MSNTYIGTQIATDDDIIARGEGALGSLVTNCQHRRGWSAHSANTNGIAGLLGAVLVKN